MSEDAGGRLPDLDTLTLEKLIMIADSGSFRAAAASMFVSQSSLSRMVARLEKDLQVTLFERGPGGAIPTGAGRRLIDGARRLLGAAHEILESVRADTEVPIRLGASATGVGSFLAEFLAFWIPHHRDTPLEILEGGAVGLGELLARRDCDVAIVATPVPPQLGHLLLYTCTVVAVLPSDHPLAKDQGPIPVGDLADSPLLTNNPDFLSTRVLLAACTQAQILPTIIYQSQSGQTLAALAEVGLGVAIMSDNVDLRGFNLPTRVLTDLSGRPLSFDLHVAWWDNSKSSRARTFAEELVGFVSNWSEQNET